VVVEISVVLFGLAVDTLRLAKSEQFRLLKIGSFDDFQLERLSKSW
jgi:hypothetical protein